MKRGGIVMSNRQEHQQAATANKLSLKLDPHYFEQVYAIMDMELRKMLREPTEIFSRAVQPVLWLIIFGEVFSRIKGIPTGGLSYESFMAPGILAQSVLFSAIFYGINVIWEKDMGVVHKLLVSPAPRSALILGKSFSSGFRGLIQGVIIYIVAIFMNISLDMNPIKIIGVIFTVILGSAIFSTFSLIIACWVKSRDRFMGVGQLLTMPLFFASSAIYPLALMPDWLKIVARFNPLTYMVDALRSIMLRGTISVEGLPLDYIVMIGTFIALSVIVTKLYPDLVR